MGGNVPKFIACSLSLSLAPNVLLSLLSVTYQHSIHTDLKLGLMGVTVLYSSGDYGVAGNGGQCIIPSTGEYGTGANATRFNPSFPGTCPYITSVGATQVNPNSTVFQPESACEQGTLFRFEHPLQLEY